MLGDIHHGQEGMATICSDNTLVIALSKTFVFHKRTKHIYSKYHFIRELINNDEIVLQHYRSHEQFVDIFTRPLVGEIFVYLRNCFRIFNGSSCD